MRRRGIWRSREESARWRIVVPMKSGIGKQRRNRVTRKPKRIIGAGVEKICVLVQSKARAAADSVIEHGGTQAQCRLPVPKDASEQARAESGVVSQSDSRPQVFVVRVVVAALTVRTAAKTVAHYWRRERPARARKGIRQAGCEIDILIYARHRLKPIHFVRHRVQRIP